MRNLSKKSLFMLSGLLPLTTLLTSACSVLPEQSAGRTYYVDSAGGDDSNSGTSHGNAWKSLVRINSFRTFGPGDRILLKAGSMFQGPSHPPVPLSTGSEGYAAEACLDPGGDSERTCELVPACERLPM